jgi:hypothetical protein
LKAHASTVTAAIAIVAVPAILWGFALVPASGEIGTQVPAPLGDTFNGAIRMTTADDGSWTAVTVAAQPGTPLAAAFVVQYQNPPSTVVDYDGVGGVRLDKTSLAVKSVDRGWLFKFPSYSGPVRAGDTALDVIGIARYFWSEGQRRPASHEEFVRSLAKPPVCDYTQCACGGSGAQSCTCGGCSVSCYAPYEACCNGHGSCWCCQGAVRPSSGRVRGSF